MVRRTASVSLPTRASRELQAMLAKMSKPHAIPINRKLSIISWVYCRKNSNANVISAGNANLLSTLLTFSASRGFLRRNSHPAISGTNSRTMFCTSNFPTGSSMDIPALCETKCDVSSIMTGSVKSVTMLLTAVSVTDRATSPLASMENTFDELPPGQQATSTSPIKYTGGTSNSHARAKAMAGSRTICPVIPNATALGWRATFTKASLLSSVPSRNISTIRIGITIQIVFISQSLFFAAAKLVINVDSADRERLFSLG